jgi:predicted esterase
MRFPHLRQSAAMPAFSRNSPLIAIATSCLIAAAASARESPLLISGSPATTITVSLSATPPAPESEMLDRLRGIAYSGPPGDLAKSLRPARPIDGSFETAIPWLFWTLTSKKGDANKIVELRRAPSGTILLREQSEQLATKIQTYRLNGDTALRHISAWNICPSDWSTRRDALPVGQSVAWPHPVLPAIVNFDKDLLGARLLGGGFTQIDAAKRDLAVSALTVRRPKPDATLRRYGLLVWINAAPGGAIPKSLEAACDAAGIIIISPNDVPNDCPIADRCQHVLDAIATVCQTLPIDPTRIYTSGISGGGKTSAILHTCFPEIITGSIPMVGFIGYENVPAESGKMYQGQFRRPRAEVLNLLKSHRIAPITGSEDFNRDVTHATARLYTRDGFTVKVWEVPGMGHTVAPSGTFQEALTWLEEPLQQKLSANNAKGAQLASSAKDHASRKALIAAAPWSDAAWKACEELRILTQIQSPPK